MIYFQRVFRGKKQIPENEAQQEPEYKNGMHIQAFGCHTRKAQAGVVLWASRVAVVLVQGEGRKPGVFMHPQIFPEYLNLGRVSHECRLY